MSMTIMGMVFILYAIIMILSISGVIHLSIGSKNLRKHIIRNVICMFIPIINVICMWFFKPKKVNDFKRLILIFNRSIDKGGR